MERCRFCGRGIDPYGDAIAKPYEEYYCGAKVGGDEPGSLDCWRRYRERLEGWARGAAWRMSLHDELAPSPDYTDLVKEAETLGLLTEDDPSQP